MVLRLEAGSKLARQILSAMEPTGSRSYEVNTLFVSVFAEGIEVNTACVNEYGGIFSNDDRQSIAADNLPNFTARKLYAL